MRGVLVLGLVLAASVAHAQAPDCTPRKLQGHSGWVFHAAYVQSPVVPAGEVWEVHRAGAASNDSSPRDIRIQVDEPVDAQDGACCWAIPMASVEASSSTPKLSWSGQQFLWPGQRLSARMNATLADFALLWAGVKYPAACVARRLGLEAPP